MRPKTIYLLSDGTGNSAASSHRSNVWRFYQSLQLGEQSNQLAFYDDGVGSSRFPLTRALGGAFGIGLANNVQQLYASLCLHYRAGDRIAVIGFSRGAFTVRLVAAMICKLGIVPLADKDHMSAAEDHAPAAWAHLPPDRRGRAEAISREAWRTYRFRSRWRSEERVAQTLPRAPLASLFYRHYTIERFRARYLASADPAYREPNIHFLGVWDTVAAYGLPIHELVVVVDNLITPLRFNDHDISPRVLCARQALALDEARQTFSPLIWNERASAHSANVKQVWFAGVHADLGGGYPDDALANQALNWMIEECKHAALRQPFEAVFNPLREQQIQDTARFDGPLHDSRRGLAALYRFKPRNIHSLCNQSAEQTLDEVEVRTRAVVVHRSAIARTLANCDEYAPTALAKPWRYDNRSRLPIHIDSYAGEHGEASADVGQLFTLHTKARQRLHENIVLSRCAHNVCVLALVVALVLAGCMAWQWFTPKTEPTRLYGCGLFIALVLSFASLRYSQHLGRRRHSLADLGLARLRTESDRVVAAAEQGVFKQSRLERAAMQLLKWQFAKRHYMLTVKYALPVLLLAVSIWLSVVIVSIAAPSLVDVIRFFCGFGAC